LKWLTGAKTDHNLNIDYVGGWNECYTGWDLGWFQSLKQALAANGLSTKIIGPDEYYAHLTPSAQATISAPGFYTNIDVPAAHYPCDFGAVMQCTDFQMLSGLGKPMWASESNGESAANIARATNLQYIDGGFTASIVWPLIGATYSNFPYSSYGLILAEEPWSGKYLVGPGVWAMAHTTQFVQPGWQYIDSAVGRTAGDTASYVAMLSPNGSDYSIVIETAYATRSQIFSFVVTAGLAKGPVHVWSTNLNSANPDDWFVQAQDAAPVNGLYSVTLQPGFLYSITTTTGQSKGSSFAAVCRCSLHLPYADSFEEYNVGQEARLFADVNGAFEIASCGGGRMGQCLRQMAAVQPYFWWVTPALRKASNPYTLMGDVNWTDYRVSADILLEQSGAVQLLGRVGDQSLDAPSCLASYYLQVADQGNWAIVREDIDGTTINLVSGSVASLGTNTWHELALTFLGTTIRAELDRHVLGTANDPGYISGQIGFGVNGWINAQFDNLMVTSPLVLRRPVRRM
jgi:hypothetical protein